MMIITKEIAHSIKKSVLCWLATSSSENEPNVSPKEVFDLFDEDQIIIANIASPQTVKNIQTNPKVCLSFIDVLVQKGFQLKGEAEIIKRNDACFTDMEKVLLKITQGKFPFSTITRIKIHSAKKIVAPSYLLYPETTEAEQIENARRQYGL